MSNSELEDFIYHTLKFTDNKYKKIKVIQLPQIKSPCITGFFQPVILLPTIDFTPQELKFILSHELEHFNHHDLLLKFICELFVCVYWLNPLVYLIRQQLKNTLEFSNKLSITKDMDEFDKLNYLECLLKIAKNQSTNANTTTLYI